MEFIAGDHVDNHSGDNQADNGAGGIHRTVQTKAASAVFGVDGIRNQGIPRGCPDTFADTVAESDTDNGAPGIGQ